MSLVGQTLLPGRVAPATKFSGFVAVAVVVVVDVVDVAPVPAADRQKYGSPSQVIGVVSRVGSYSLAPERAQSHHKPVRGSCQTYV